MIKDLIPFTPLTFLGMKSEQLEDFTLVLRSMFLVMRIPCTMMMMMMMMVIGEKQIIVIFLYHDLVIYCTDQRRSNAESSQCLGALIGLHRAALDRGNFTT